LTWSYSENPSTSTLDAVRFEIGDTNSADPQLQDEEIEFVILQEANLKYAAAACCDRLAANYARQGDKNVGKLRLRLEQRFQQYLQLAVRLRSQAGSSPIPFAGGISVADKRARELNTDRNTGVFSVNTEDSQPNPPVVVEPAPGQWQ
jgi:hypothetical protein